MMNKEWIANNIEELGEILQLDEILPGVFSVSAKKDGHRTEYYIAAKDAPAISEQARTYGKAFAKHPDLRFYNCDTQGSGWRIIRFEVQRYQREHHLWRNDAENGDSLLTAAIYGMEEHPEYFGTFPVPAVTPRGFTIRHRTIMNGVYWLETDRCEELLAVCYPIWQAGLPLPEQMFGEQLEYDRMMGPDETLGYLFFPKKESCIPLYELSLLHPQIEKSGVVFLPALHNAPQAFYPEYTALHNAEVAGAQNKRLIESEPGVGNEFICF